MSSPYQKLLELFPKTPDFVGEITFADHPNYKVRALDGQGLLLCTSTTIYNINDRVYVNGTEIKKPATVGEFIKLDI